MNIFKYDGFIKLNEHNFPLNKSDDKVANAIMKLLKDRKFRVIKVSTDTVHKKICDVAGVRIISIYIFYEDTYHKDTRYQTYLNNEDDRLYCSVENSKKIWDLVSEKGTESISKVSDEDPFGEEDWED